jgi:folate-binding protein YgfZ
MSTTELSAPAFAPLPFACALPDWGLIHASGADAQDFLHGQLTNDLLNLPENGAQWSGYCSAKGRLYASFLVWRDGAGGFFLAVDRALAPALVKRLRMFVLRAKVVLEDVSENFSLAGVAGEPGPQALEVRRAESTTIGLPPVQGIARSLVVHPAGAAINTAVGAAGSAQEWQRLMIHAGEAWIVAATEEQFVPQMVNLDSIGAINFKKGCYPGQEVVARAHYRGAVKRRAYLAHVAGEAKAGDALFASDANGQESGTVANAAPAPQGGYDVLAVIQIASHAAAEVRLGAADGPLLQFSELPYTIPAAA